MKYRELGKTGLRVSEVGFGPEWMKGTPGETRTVAETCREGGMNLLDCWMADPLIRDNLGYAMKGHTDEWIVQGHFGACVLRPVHVLRTLPAMRSRHRHRDGEQVRRPREDAGIRKRKARTVHYVNSTLLLGFRKRGPFDFAQRSDSRQDGCLY